MMIRLCVYAMSMAMAACVSSELSSDTALKCDYSSLSQIASEPQKANGKIICAKLYSYSRHGFLAFYDMPIDSLREAVDSEALLIGDKEALGLFRGNYPKDGQPMLFRGRIDLHLPCFAGKRNSCVPIKLPIYIKSIEIIHPEAATS
jgi:hypothetical protein